MKSGRSRASAVAWPSLQNAGIPTLRRLVLLAALHSFVSATAAATTPDQAAPDQPDPAHQAQPAAAAATLRGTLLEFGSGRPVAGATVAVGESAVITDESGAFVLRVPAGPIEVLVAGDDHAGARFAETLLPSETLDVRYRLERRAWDDEVVVYGESREEVSRQVLTTEELRRVPGSFGDPIRALQSLPSVTRGADLTGDLLVRGAEGTNTAASIDGIRVPFLYHFLVGRSIVDPAVIEDVAFYPSAAPARFGDVSQAVVDARTPSGPADSGLHGRVHADLLDGGASLAASLGRGWTLRGGARVGWLGQLASVGMGVVDLSKGAGRQTPGVHLPYEDHFLRMSHEVGANRLSFTLLGARDGLRIVPAQPPQAEGVSEGASRRDQLVALEDQLGYDPYLMFDSRFFRVQARFDHTVGRAGWSAWATAGRDRQQNLIEGLGLIGASGLQYAQLAQAWGSTGARARLAPNDHLLLEMGGEVVAQPSRVTPLLPIGAVEHDEVADASTEVTKLYAGPYAELSVSAGPVLVKPAFRVSVHHLEHWELVPEPQLSVDVALSPVWSVTAFGGLLSQGPDVTELAEGFSVDELSVTRAAQSVVGVKARWPNGLGVDVTAYETEMWNLVVRDERAVLEVLPPRPGFDPDTATSGSVPFGELVRVPEYRSARGRAYGLEAQVRMQPRGRQFGWIAASVGRSRRTVDGVSYRSDADVPVSVLAVYGAGLPKGWGISGRGQVSSGLVFTPLHGVSKGWVLDASDPASYWTNQYDPMSGDTNGARYPAYARFDIRVDKTWTAQRARWTAYLDVYNVTNMHNPLWATYDWNYSELQTRAYVPVLPTLGLEVEY